MQKRIKQDWDKEKKGVKVGKKKTENTGQ